MVTDFDDLENILNGKEGKRQILVEYQAAELERLNPVVYEPLLRSRQASPKLRSLIDSVRSAKDPLSTIDTLKAGSYVLGSFRTIKDSVIETFDEIFDEDLSDLEDIFGVDEIKEIKELREIVPYIKEVINNLDYMDSLLKSTVSVMTQHYDGLANSIREVSDSRKLKTSEVVRNTNYLYEALRINTPSREWAEKFITITTNGSLELMNSISTLGLVIEKSMGKSSVSSEILETRTAYRVLSDALKEYRLRELDVIYAK